MGDQQVPLLTPRAPPPLPERIALHLGDCADVLAGVAETADLCIADPPWTYHGGQAGAAASDPSDHYGCLTVPEIRAHLGLVRARRIALWLTWPIMPEWAPPAGWRWVTGGAWTKSEAGDQGHYGPGYHWAGCSEPVLIYAGETGAPNDRATPLRNAWVEPPGLHSRKPVGWMVQWVRRWVPEGGLVVDPYAGLGSVAEAVLLAGGGRRYVGAEIDPVRHASALALLAQVPTNVGG